VQEGARPSPYRQSLLLKPTPIMPPKNADDDTFSEYVTNPALQFYK
jgi:hypothetical protein